MSRSMFNTYKDFTNGTPDEPVNVKWFGAVGDGFVAADGSTPDQTAIEAAIAYCVAKNLTLGIPDGVYKHKTTINWAFNRLRVMALGDNVVFVHTGTGVAHSFSGIANYPGTQGCVGGVFGGPGRIMLKGNPAASPSGTSQCVYVDNWHFGHMKVAIHDCETGLYTDDSGIVGSASVSTTYDVRVTSNADGGFLRKPGRGMELNKIHSCVFIKPIIEGCGNGGVAAIRMNGCVGVKFDGGTSEGNESGGIFIDSGCHRNTFSNFHAELNGSSYDWDIAGNYNSFQNCAGGATPSGQRITGTGNLFTGGDYDTVANNGDRNVFLNVEFITSYSGTDVNATIINPRGTATGAVAVDNAPSILGNKTINTQNAITLKIDGNAVNAVTGTGSTVALSASPRFTGQVGIGADVAPDTTLTVNDNNGGTDAPDSTSNLHLIAADAANGGIFLDSFSYEASIVSRFSGGTRAARLAAGPNVNYFGIYGEAWNGSAYVYGAAFEFRTLNAQTGSDSSHKAVLRLVPPGSALLTDVMLWGPGVAIGAGAADPGAGNLNLGGGVLQNNGTAPTGTGAYVRAVSPALTGSPTAPTATVNDNSTKIATTAYVDAAWTSYTPSSIASETVGATPATYTLNSARYKQLGKTVTVRVDLTVANQGVGNSGAILISLPFTGAEFAYVGSLVEYNTTGDGGTVFLNISATRMYCAKANYATTLIVTGYRIVAQVTYEIP